MEDPKEVLYKLPGKFIEKISLKLDGNPNKKLSTKSTCASRIGIHIEVIDQTTSRLACIILIELITRTENFRNEYSFEEKKLCMLIASMFDK